MPIYLYWGEDEFATNQAVTQLRDRLLDPAWGSFNYEKVPGDRPDAVIYSLNQALTPPFGAGNRLVWLAETTVCQHCPPELAAELDRSLAAIPETSTLLLTTPNKLDSRLKSTKLLKKYAEVREFSTIPPWKTELLVKRSQQVAKEIGVKLTASAAQLLAEAVGNDTRRLYNEVEKLKVYTGDREKALDTDEVASLVSANTQNSLQLANAIRDRDIPLALGLVSDLIDRNEPALRISATLVGQFRTWLWVKLMVEARERDDRAIAAAAEVGNPKRIYFLKQEVRSLSLKRLQQMMALLLELEADLKSGADEKQALQTKVIEMCE